MGDLIGHIFPGLLFTLCGLWWLIHMLQDYFRSRCKNQPPYRSRVWYSNRCCCNFPVEGAVKVLVVTVGIIGETVTTFKQSGPFVYMPNAQHMTMYFFFGLNGAMDILAHYRFGCLPSGIEVTTGVMAFGAEGFLFYNHLHGRPMIDVQCHMFIFYAIVAIICCVFLEIKYRDFVIPSLSRAFFTLLQGTWFVQVGFILYPPAGRSKWDLEDHHQMMLVTLLFTWHAAVDFLASLALAAIIYAYMKRCRKLDDVMYQRVKDETVLPPPSRINGDIMHMDNAEQLLDTDSDSV